MSEWWTYRLSDFLMFSPRTYGRLVEQYNTELWPGPLLAAATGAVALGLARARGAAAARWLAALLALAWAWVAWAFHWPRYAQVFLGAPYLAAAFALQAGLLAAIALVPARRVEPPALVRKTGWLLAGAAVLAYPLLAPAFGQPWRQAEVFGWMPEPTALATLGMLMAAGLRLPAGPGWLVFVVPGLALVAGLATQWALRA